MSGSKGEGRFTLLFLEEEMRPLKLVLRGFKPFRERQEIDFSGLEFFVIRGPTGSGKSSILDAIAFALFGKDGIGQYRRAYKQKLAGTLRRFHL